MKKKIRIGLLLLTVAALVGTPVAMAFPEYKDAFTTKYNTTNTKLDTCSTCHVSPFGGAPWNPYGLDVRSQLGAGATIDQALTNTEQMDSDNDTFGNIVEIDARTFPGNASDHPVPAAVTTLNVSASPTSVTAGIPTSVTFTVTGAGAAVSGATVTLSGNATGSGTTDANGSVAISVNATGAGTITATASMSGFTSVSAIITVQDIMLQPTGTIPDPEVEVYDDNHDGRFNKTEAVKAVMDFFAGSAPKNRAIKVIVAHFSGDTTASIKLSYANWSMWPGKGQFYPGTMPHGALLTTYVTDNAFSAIAGKNGSMPAGSIIVKENYGPDRQLMALTIMYKAQGYDAAHNDWFWAKYTPDGRIDAEGQVQMCIDCHAQKVDNDYLFTSPLN